MSETTAENLSEVSETLLIPLYYRAMETQRPDAMIKDEKAVELIKQLSSESTIHYNADWFKQTPLSKANKVLRIMLTREMDHYARDFLDRHLDTAVVQIGCGLDSRFERVDDGEVEWYDLDLPDVIEMRRRLIGDERARYHLLGCSVLEETWLETVTVHHGRTFLFLAEGDFLYFEEARGKSLVLRLRDHFPGAELIFDGWRPFEIWIGNRVLGGLLNWGFWHGQEIESWGKGINLLDEWGYFDRPEPRLHPFRWIAPLFRLIKPMRVFHFQLGFAGI